MNLLSSLVRAFLPRVPSTPMCIAVRSYEKKPYQRRYGFIDKIDTTHGAPLPRLKDGQRLPMPIYSPADAWSTKKVSRGQNDYIDILGDGSIHPVKLMTNVPYWLRGFAGNEYQRLLRQNANLGFHMKKMRPLKYEKMRKRMKHVWRYLNYKTNLGR